MLSIGPKRHNTNEIGIHSPPFIESSAKIEEDQGVPAIVEV